MDILNSQLKRQNYSYCKFDDIYYKNITEEGYPSCCPLCSSLCRENTLEEILMENKIQREI